MGQRLRPFKSLKTLKTLKPPVFNLKILAASAIGALLLGIGAGYWLPRLSSFSSAPGSSSTGSSSASGSSSSGQTSSQPWFALGTQELTTLTQTGQPADADRARYRLAVLTLTTNPQEALRVLDGLDQRLPNLAPQILVLRAKAQTALGQPATAWDQLLERQPASPAIVEALYAKSQALPPTQLPQQYSLQDRALKAYPAHPVTIELAKQRLKTDPNHQPSLLAIARYGLHLKDQPLYLARLTTSTSTSPSPNLTPADWEAIAFAYWERQDYANAAKAYAKAPATAKTRYRTARSLQLSEQATAARPIFTQVTQQFPQSPEAALAFKRLAELAPSDQAIAYWSKVASASPRLAPEAILSQAKLLDAEGKSAAASQLRQQLLQQHGSSDAAAELRWTLAERYAQSNQLAAAIDQAQSLTQQSPRSPLAPEANFWLGRWRQAQGDNAGAKAAWANTLKTYPESYYAWRSATYLGLPVGDFSTIQRLTPNLIPPSSRTPLLTGSAALQDLYQLGDDRAAWYLWQTEFTDRYTPTIAQQYTDGIIRQGIGDYLDGIFMVSSLALRDKPDEQQQYQSLQRQRIFWQGLYPLAYSREIQAAAAIERLNPALVTGLIRQESRFTPAIKSSVGATGLMQVMPETASFIAGQIRLKKYDMTQPRDNLKLGTWYLNYVHQDWSGNSMLAVASYNAGPGNVQDWQNRFKLTDPDKFVEKIPFPETKGYVEHVFENYWNYLRLYNPETFRLVSQYSPIHAVLGF
jgi:soluble lytic murein transglycosylase